MSNNNESQPNPARGRNNVRKLGKSLQFVKYTQISGKARYFQTAGEEIWGDEQKINKQGCATPFWEEHSGLVYR